MNLRLKDYALIALVLALLLFSSYKFIFSSGYLLYADSIPVSNTSLFSFFNAWNDYMNFGGSTIDLTSVFVFFLRKSFILHFLNVLFADHFALFLAIISIPAAFVSMFLFSKKKFEENTAPVIISSLVYAINPLVIYWVTAGHFGHVYGYAILPVIVLLYNDMKDGDFFGGVLKRDKQVIFPVIYASLAFGVMQNISPHISLILALFIAADVAWTFLTDRSKTLNAFAVFAVIMFAGLLLNMYSYAPFVLFPEVKIEKNSWEYVQEGSFVDAVLLKANNYWAVGYVMLALLVLAFKRSKQTAFLLLVIVGTVFIAKGIGEPFGEFSRLLFENVPFMVGFREPMKFLALAIFAYAIIAGVLAKALLESSVVKRKSVNILLLKTSLIAFFVLWLLLVNPTFLSGDYGGYVAVVRVPEEAKVLDAFVSFNNSGSRSFFPVGTSPEEDYGWEENVKNPGLYAPPFGLYRLSTPIIAYPFGEASYATRFIRYVRANMNEDRIWSSAMLEKMNVRYTVLDFNLLSNSTDYEKSANIFDHLKKQGFAYENISNFIVFSNPSENSQFYASDSYASVVGPLKAYSFLGKAFPELLHLPIIFSEQKYVSKEFLNSATATVFYNSDLLDAYANKGEIITVSDYAADFENSGFTDLDQVSFDLIEKGEMFYSKKMVYLNENGSMVLRFQAKPEQQSEEYELYVRAKPSPPEFVYEIDGARIDGEELQAGAEYNVFKWVQIGSARLSPGIHSIKITNNASQKALIGSLLVQPVDWEKQISEDETFRKVYFAYSPKYLTTFSDLQATRIGEEIHQTGTFEYFDEFDSGKWQRDAVAVDVIDYEDDFTTSKIDTDAYETYNLTRIKQQFGGALSTGDEFTGEAGLIYKLQTNPLTNLQAELNTVFVQFEGDTAQIQASTDGINWQTVNQTAWNTTKLDVLKADLTTYTLNQTTTYIKFQTHDGSPHFSNWITKIKIIGETDSSQLITHNQTEKTLTFVPQKNLKRIDAPPVKALITADEFVGDAGLVYKLQTNPLIELEAEMQTIFAVEGGDENSIRVSTDAVNWHTINQTSWNNTNPDLVTANLTPYTQNQTTAYIKFQTHDASPQFSNWITKIKITGSTIEAIGVQNGSVIWQKIPAGSYTLFSLRNRGLEQIGTADSDGEKIQLHTNSNKTIFAEYVVISKSNLSFEKQKEVMVEYQKISSAFYKVKTFSEKPFIVVFRETYSPHWSMCGEKPFLVDYYANGFYLDAGEWECDLVYQPDGLFRSLLFLTILAYAALFLLSIYGVWRGY